MKLFPAASSTLRAEQRLEQSKQQLRRQLDHIQSTLTGPSSLLIVSGIGALLGTWLARRKTAAVASSSAGFPVRSLLFALLIRFILQRITKRSRTDES